MPLTLDLRDRLIFPALAVAAAMLFGALLGARPLLALAFFGAAATLALAFLAPVTHLTLLLILTVVVPYSFQNQSAGSAGLLPSDVLLLTGMLRAGVVLLMYGIDRRRLLAAVTCVVFLVGALFQLIHGLHGGAEISAAGAEFRHVLAYGTLLVGLPILLDPDGRRRLLKGLLVVGLLLGLFGIAQWALNISYGAAGDVGVRSGVRLTTGGRGQVQGGLYAFPVAIGVSFAALMSGALRSLWSRVGVLAVLSLNAVSLLLTFERTFWVGAVVAVGVIALRLGGRSRLRALIWIPLAALLSVAALAALAPSEFVTARERLLSINQYGSDNSLRYRVIESRHVVAKINEHPVIGSGLADTIWWGRPYAGVPPEAYAFSHNGYLWMAWKLGVPLTALLVALILLAIFWRGPPGKDRLYAAVRAGCQGGLLALLVINVTWPAFRILSITPAIGLFIAMCAVSGGERTGGRRHPLAQPLNDRSSAT